jgi:hypothetical protein
VRRLVIILVGLGALAGCGGPVPKAKDGANLKACFDGRCEVDVRAPVRLDLDPSTGVTHLSIPRIGPKGVRIEGSTTGGGTITLDLYADPGAFAEGVINGVLSISSMATVDGHALLRLAPV